MDFYIELAFLLLGAVFLMTWLPIFDSIRDETWKREDFWKLLEVTGLWLAALVGLSAIFVSSHDAHEQLATLIDQARNTSEQVKEAKSQRLLLVEQTRAHIRHEDLKVTQVTSTQPDGTQKVSSWKINPVLANSGATDARDFRGWYQWNAIDIPFDVANASSRCPKTMLHPVPLANPQIVSAGTKFLQSALDIPIEHVIAASRGEKTIIVSGHIEYRDIYPETPLHHEEWCIALVPNDVDRMIFSPFALQSSVD